MATIGDVANKVVDKLKRQDKRVRVVELVKSAYLLICGKVPFSELQSRGTVPLVAGTETYNLSSLLSPNLAGIRSIRINFSATRGRRLRRSHSRVYDALNAPRQGDPATYAREGLGIELNPIPISSSYTLQVRYWNRPTIATDAETTVLVIPVEWEELLYWEGLYRTYTDLEMHDKAATLVTPMPMPRQKSPKRTIQFEAAIIPRLWNDLLMTMEGRENVDEDFSINPVVRHYTHMR